MNESFGAWMLTGGARGDLDADARQPQHLRTLRELASERRAARRAERRATVKSIIETLRARALGKPSGISPHCCLA